MPVLGARGLVVGSAASAGPAANPYEAIAGLNCFFSPDLNAIVYDDIVPACAAVANRSAIETVPLLVQPDSSSAPAIATFNGTTRGFVFDRTSVQRLTAWNAAYDPIGGAFTLFALIKTSTAASLLGIFAKGIAVGRWRFATQDGFAALNLVEDGTATERTIFSDALVTDGQPHRVICIFDPANAPDATMTMVVDGVLQASTNTWAGTLQANPAEPVCLGALAANNGTASFGFTGLVRDVGTYNVPLRGAQIGQLDAIMIKRFT